MISTFNIFENMQQAKKYLDDNNTSESDDLFQELKYMLKGKEGYMGWFTKITYDNIDKYYPRNQQNRQNLNDLFKLVFDNKKYHKSLPKPIIQYNSVEELIDDIENLKLVGKARKMVNEFPSKQKSFIDLDNKEHVSILTKLYDDESNNRFIKKISRYDTQDVLISAIRNFIDNLPSVEFSSIIKKLKDTGTEITYSNEDDDIIIGRMREYNQCKTLGAKTSWCIANDKGTFYDYAQNEAHGQYIIYLLDIPQSDDNNTIGLTIAYNKYRTAHDVTDGHVSKTELNALLSEHGFDMSDLYLTFDKLTQQNINDLPYNKISKFYKDNIDDILSKKNYYTKSDANALERDDKEAYIKYDVANKKEFYGNRLKENNITNIKDFNENYHRIIKGSLGLDDIFSIGYTYKDYKKHPDIVDKFDDSDNRNSRSSSSDKDFFIKEFTSDKKPKLGSGFSVYQDINMTFNKMNYYSYTKSEITFDNVVETLTGYGINFSATYINDLIDFFDNTNFKPTEDELYNLIIRINRPGGMFNDYLRLYFRMIDNNIKVDDNTDNAIKYLLDKRSPIESWYLDEVKKYIDKDNYKDDYVKIINNNNKNSFKFYTSITSGMDSSMTQERITVDEWDDKYSNMGLILDPSVYNEMNNYQLLLSYIVLMAKCNKIDNLYSLNLDWGGVNRIFYRDLSLVITNRFSYNSNNDNIVEFSLTDDDRQKLYKWFKEHVYSTYADKSNMNIYIKVMLYFFDKPRFDNMLEYISDIDEMPYHIGGSGYSKGVSIGGEYDDRFELVYSILDMIIKDNTKQHYEAKEPMYKFDNPTEDYKNIILGVYNPSNISKEELYLIRNKIKKHTVINIPQDMLNVLNGLLDKDLLKYNPEISKTEEVVVESFKGYMIDKLLN